MNTTANAKPNQFSLVKGEERYLIRCTPGDEEETIGQLIAWAKNRDLAFDWFDAAVLTRQITQQLFSRLVGEPSEP